MTTLAEVIARVISLEAQVAELERITLPPPSATLPTGTVWTVEQIDALKTDRGGWTKEGMAQMGVTWPPLKGWRQRLLHGEDPNRLTPA